MSELERHSHGLAAAAFKAVDSEARKLRGDEQAGRQRLARAQEFPIILQRSGLTTALALYEAKGGDYAFVATAVSGALGEKRAADTCRLDTAAYLVLSSTARTFAWWLKRASEATWAPAGNSPETAVR